MKIEALRKTNQRRRISTHVLFLKMAFIIALISTTHVLANEATYKLSRESLQLEKEVWTSSDDLLWDVEAKIVKQIQVNPRDSFAFYLLSHLNIRKFSESPDDLGLLKQASEMAQQSIDLSPKSDYGYIALAETLDVMGQTDRGTQLLTSVAGIGVEPTWRHYFTLARLGAQRFSQEEMLGNLEQALAFDQTQPEIIIPYIIAIIQTGIPNDRQLQAYYSWDKKYSHPLFKQSIAVALTEQGNPGKAHIYYQSIIKNNSNAIEARVNDAILLYKELNQEDKAIESFNQLLKDTGGGTQKISKSMLSMINAHLGVALLKIEKNEDAGKIFKQAITDTDDKMNMLEFIVTTYRHSKKSKYLPNLLLGISKKIKPSGLLYALIGETLSEDLANHSDAIKAFSDAILLEPNRSDFYNGMGLTYYRMSKPEEALVLFQEATKIDPNDATAMYNGACMLSILGKMKESLGALQEALILDPKLAEQALIDSDLKNIKSTPDFKKILETTAAINKQDEELDEENAH